MRAIKFRRWKTIICSLRAVDWLVNYPFDGISDAGDPITTPEDDYQLIDWLRVHVRCGRSNFDAGGPLSVRRAQLIDWSIIRSSLDGVSDAGQLLLTHTSPRYGSEVQSVLTSPLAPGLRRYTYGYLPRRSQVAMNKLSSVRRVGNRTLVHWVTRLTTRPSTHRVTVIVR